MKKEDIVFQELDVEKLETPKKSKKSKKKKEIDFSELDVGSIVVVPSDTEIPVYDNPNQTKRPLCANYPDNSTVVDRLESILPSNLPAECSSDLFEGRQIQVIDNIEELQKLISEVLMRFDTDPKYYTKSDYFYLLKLIYQSLIHLYRFDGQLIWVGEPYTDEHRVEFMKVSGSLTAFENAKIQHPKAVIFYQGRNGNQTLYKIFANGYTYDLPTYEDYLEVKNQIEILNGDASVIGSVEYKIQLAILDYLIKNIDNTPSNGVYLTLNNGTLGIHLDLVTYENNGAMASLDKIKLDELEWVTIN